MKLKANKKMFPHHLPSIVLDRWVLIHNGPNLNWFPPTNKRDLNPKMALKIIIWNFRLFENYYKIIFPSYFKSLKEPMFEIWMKS
jgi:hypothetical protein